MRKKVGQFEEKFRRIVQKNKEKVKGSIDYERVSKEIPGTSVDIIQMALCKRSWGSNGGKREEAGEQKEKRQDSLNENSEKIRKDMGSDEEVQCLLEEIPLEDIESDREESISQSKRESAEEQEKSCSASASFSVSLFNELPCTMNKKGNFSSFPESQNSQRPLGEDFPEISKLHFNQADQFQIEYEFLRCRLFSSLSEDLENSQSYFEETKYQSGFDSLRKIDEAFFECPESASLAQNNHKKPESLEFQGNFQRGQRDEKLFKEKLGLIDDEWEDSFEYLIIVGF